MGAVLKTLVPGPVPLSAHVVFVVEYLIFPTSFSNQMSEANMARDKELFTKLGHSEALALAPYAVGGGAAGGSKRPRDEL